MKYIRTSIPFILCLLTLPVYIYLYKNSLNGFWILFVVERFTTPFLGKKIEKLLDEDPRLFILIMIGECIDKVLEKIISNIRKNRNERGF